MGQNEASVFSLIIAILLLFAVIALFSYVALGALFFERVLMATKTYFKNIVILIFMAAVFLLVRSLTNIFPFFTEALSQKHVVSFDAYTF